MAQLCSTTSLDPKLNDLVLVGDPVPFQAGGYWLPATRVIPDVLPGASTMVGAFAWNIADGTTFAEASASGTYGRSSLIQVVLGGDGMPAANMVGLRPIAIIPEPSSVGLLALGLAGLLLARAASAPAK